MAFWYKLNSSAMSHPYIFGSSKIKRAVCLTPTYIFRKHATLTCSSAKSQTISFSISKILASLAYQIALLLVNDLHKGRKYVWAWVSLAPFSYLILTDLTVLFTHRNDGLVTALIAQSLWFVIRFRVILTITLFLQLLAADEKYSVSFQLRLLWNHLVFSIFSHLLYMH